MTKDEALKMAIEALNDSLTRFSTFNEMQHDAIQACKDALEQPTLTYEDGFAHGYEAHRAEQALEQPAQKVKVLYEKNGIQTCEILPAPSWQGLSDIERYLNEGRSPEEIEYARAIEQALKEKNT